MEWRQLETGMGNWLLGVTELRQGREEGWQRRQGREGWYRGIYFHRCLHFHPRYARDRQRSRGRCRGWCMGWCRGWCRGRVTEERAQHPLRGRLDLHGPASSFTKRERALARFMGIIDSLPLHDMSTTARSEAPERKMREEGCEDMRVRVMEEGGCREEADRGRQKARGRRE